MDIPVHNLMYLRCFANLRLFKSKKEQGISVGNGEFGEGPFNLLTPQGFAIPVMHCVPFSLSSCPLAVFICENRARVLY